MKNTAFNMLMEDMRPIRESDDTVPDSLGLLCWNHSTHGTVPKIQFPQ